MQKIKSLGEKLPVWQFVDSYLVFSDHSLGAGFKIKGVDITCLDPQEINLVVDRLEKLLISLENGTSVQVFYKLTPHVEEKINQHLEISQDSHSSIREVAKFRADFLTKLAKEGNFFKPEIFLFVRSTPVKTKKLKIFEKQEKWQSFSELEFSQALNSFEKTVNLVRSSLLSAGFEPEILSNSRWFDLMFNHLNSSRVQKIGKTSLQLPSNSFSNSLAEQLCLTDLEVHPKSVKIGDTFAKVITLKTLPEHQTFASMIDTLLKLPFPFEITQSVQIPDQRKEQEKLSIQRRLAHSMAAGSKNVRDIESEAQLNDLETLIEEIVSGSEKIIYSDLSVIIQGISEEELDEKADEVLKAFRQMNSAEAVVETLPCFDAYMKALPGRCELFRPRKMKSSNAVHFMPMFASWEGNDNPVCLIPNREGVLTGIDLFASHLSAWNGIIVGGTGSGKSMTVCQLILSFAGQRPSPKVIWIDNGASSQKLVESLDGEFINLGLDAGVKLNVFNLEPGETSPSTSKVKLILAILEIILKEDEKPALPKKEKALLEEVIYQTYESCYPRIPILSDLRKRLKDHSSVEMRNYAQTLYSWTGNTAYGRLLDAESNITLKKNLTTVEISGLNSHPTLQNVFLLLLTNFIRTEAASDLKTPYLCIIDEAWRIFQGSESGRELALESYRLMRKFLAGIYCLTQNYRDFLSDPQIAEAILPNTTHVFILKQKKIDWNDFKKTMGLNDAEIAAIQSLEIKKGEYSEVFYMQDEKRSLLRVRPDRLSYLICTSDGKDKAMIEEMVNKYPELSKMDILKLIAQPKSANADL